MTLRTLKQPPLVEHVFEVRWRHPEGREALYDEYELGLGRLFERMKGDLELSHRERMPGHMPREAFASLGIENLVFDRFVPSPTKDQQLSYPLVQYGPGVVSYNVDRDNYEWGSVRQRAVELFGIVSDVHEGLPGGVSGVSLRAIDFFKTDDPASFLRDKLGIKIQTELASLKQLAGAVETPRFRGTWKLEADRTQLQVATGPASIGEENGLLLDIRVESLGEALVTRGIDDLISYQHTLTGDAFFALLTDELHDDLGRT